MVEHYTIQIAELVDVYLLNGIDNKRMSDGEGTIIQFWRLDVGDELELNSFEAERTTVSIYASEGMRRDEPYFAQIVSSRDIDASVDI